MDLNTLLDSLASTTENSGNFSLNSFEESEAYEIENLLVRQGVSRSAAKKQSRVAVKRPAFKQPLQQAARANGGQGIKVLGGGMNTPSFSAQFDIKVRRVTNNIAGVALPFVIFAQLDAKNGFRQIMNNIPAGITLTSVDCGESDGAPDKMIFTFTNANGLVDTVEVTCSQYPYPSFLEAMATNKFRASKVRYGISDIAQQSQFNNQFLITTRSMFGKTTTDSISISSFKDPNQQQTGLIDVDGEFGFDRETGILSTINGVALFEANLSMFIEAFEKNTI